MKISSNLPIPPLTIYLKTCSKILANTDFANFLDLDLVVRFNENILLYFQIKSHGEDFEGALHNINVCIKYDYIPNMQNSRLFLFSLIILPYSEKYIKNFLKLNFNSA